MAASKQRESQTGYHWINTFQGCPRKWHIKYNLGLLPTKLGKALIFGKAWHEGMDKFYNGADYATSLATIYAELDEAKLQFHTLDEYNEVRLKAEPMFKAWYEAIGLKLHDEYEVLFVEEQFEPKIADIYTMTIRPDAVVRRRSTGEILIPEHKTTGYSEQSMVENVDRGDQATAYTWGLLAVHPEFKENFAGVLLDVAYARMYKGAVSGTPTAKQITITRSRYDLAAFELSMLGLFRDIASRIKKYEARPELDALYYPRNGSSCSEFTCEYHSLCRQHLDSRTVLGAAYKVDPWSGRERLLREASADAESSAT